MHVLKRWNNVLNTSRFFSWCHPRLRAGISGVRGRRPEIPALTTPNENLRFSRLVTSGMTMIAKDASKLLFFLGIVVSIFIPTNAHAVIVGGEICPGQGLMNRIVPCISNTIIAATENFLVPFSAVLASTISALCLLAIVVFGAKAALGNQRQLKSETIILGIKLGLVIMFTSNFGGLFPHLMSIIDSMIIMVSGALVYEIDLRCPFELSIWMRIDCTLDQLIGGILPGSLISSGMIGFLFASLFSPTIGVTVFFLGMGFLVIIVLALAKATYVFLSAYIGIAMMVVVSPLFIPLILFRVTKAYFEKWLRLLIGLMVQPIFLFAYITMLLIAFDVVVFTGERSVFHAIAGPNANAADFKLGDFLLEKDANGDDAFKEQNEIEKSINMDPEELAQGLGVQGIENTGLFGKLGNWADNLNDRAQIFAGANAHLRVPVKAVDFIHIKKQANFNNLTDTEYMLGIILAMFTAVIVAYIFYTWLEYIPYLGTSLTGEVLSLPNLARGFSMDDTLNNFRGQIARDPGKPFDAKGAPR